MTSTYSTRLRFEQQAAGDNLNTWGPKINAALLRLEEAIAGRQAISTYPITLTTANGTTDQAREMFLDCSGAGGTITIPAVEKLYFVRNNSAATITVTTGSGTTATVNVGEVKAVLSDGTNVYAEFLTGAYLPLAGGTLTGGLTGTTGGFTGNVTAGGFIATANGANITGGLAVASGGANIAGAATVTGTLGVTGSATLSGGATVGTVLTASGTSGSGGSAFVISTANTGYGGQFQLNNSNGGATSPNKYVRVNSSGNLEFLNSNYSTVIASLSDAGAFTATSFSGAGTGLTGTAASLSIGGNAATATSATSATTATTATNQSGGTLNATSGTVSGALSAGSFSGTALASTAQTLTGSSNTQAITPAGFAGSSSLAASGYYKLPGGLIMQWGNTGAVSGSTASTVTFPIAFTNVWSVQATKAESGGFVNDSVNIANVSASGFQAANGATAATTVYWFAVGN